MQHETEWVVVSEDEWQMALHGWIKVWLERLVRDEAGKGPRVHDRHAAIQSCAEL